MHVQFKICLMQKFNMIHPLLWKLNLRSSYIKLIINGIIYTWGTFKVYKKENAIPKHVILHFLNQKSLNITKKDSLIAVQKKSRKFL